MILNFLTDFLLYFSYFIFIYLIFYLVTLSLSEKTKVLILHKLKLKKGIVLEDHEKEFYYTYKVRTPFGGYGAYVYPTTKTGYISLNEDGTVISKRCSYIKRWKDL